MKYTEEEISNIRFKEYIELIVKELNDNGFSRSNGNPYELGKDIMGGWLWRSYSVFMTTINDKKAIDFLKAEGLIDNGRCPLTGLNIRNDEYTFVSDHNSNIKFQASAEWKKLTGSSYNYGCIIALIALLLVIISLFIWGFSTNLLIAGGCVVAYLIFNVFRNMSKMGIELNYQNAARDIGITPIAVKTCIRFQKEMDIMLHQSHSSKRIMKLPSIAKGDLNAFLEWQRD